MKEALKQHINSILSSAKVQSVAFEIYDCKEDVLPYFFTNVDISQEFLVVFDVENFLNDANRQKNIEALIGKKMSFCEHKKNIFLLEGDSLSSEDKAKILYEKYPPEDGDNSRELSFVKKHTTLPQFLNNYIFDILKGNYKPDYTKFNYNLDLSEEENRIYLGTYFPRSYAESFCIYDNLFKNKKIHGSISKLSVINVLDVGCGTGGNLFGLLFSLRKHFSSLKVVNICCIDGNLHALNILSKIIKGFSDSYSAKINIKCHNLLLENVIDNKEMLNSYRFNGNNFNFIFSFKVMCEIISKGNSSAYYNFCTTFLPFLDNVGFLTLLDVTTKQNNGIFAPIMLNEQVNKALKHLKEYKTIIPTPCSLYEEICNKDCFTQQQFEITHKCRRKDKSKVAYRIIVRDVLFKSLVKNIDTKKYIVQNSDNISDENACFHTIKNNIVEDGFKCNF